ncbi:GNAT family N-acetyltransferase [Naumannella huperziae]
MVHIDRVTTPDPGGAGAFDEVAAIDRAVLIETHGNDDLADSAAARRARFADQSDKARELLLIRAEPGGPALGAAEVIYPLRENVETAETTVQIVPGHRRAGLGSALAQAAEDAARARGRTRMLGFAEHPDGAEGPGAVLPPTGVGRAPRDSPPVAFALGRGYRLEQAERMSTQPVPLDPGVRERLQRDADERSGGYRLLGWRDAAPAEHVDQIAELFTRMSVDVPHAELGYQEEVWDADRVRRREARAAAGGRTAFTTVAQHIGSGRLAAFTIIEVPPDKPAVGYQAETLVRAEHRGHRLGLAIKLANLDLVAAHRPQIARIHTWNAGENEWMLAINLAMGYRPGLLETVWSKRLSGV